WLTGGFLWQLRMGASAAVMIFFVLSGYVIDATTSPRTTPAEYAAARLSRLYSVIVPALLLTFAFDHLGMTFGPDLYFVIGRDATFLKDITENLPTRYATNLLMVHEWWTVKAEPNWPGSNLPFWSMSYEATYYLAFGIILFLRGWTRIGLLLLLALVSGPCILMLWPIWMAGVGLWRLRPYLSRHVALPAILAGLAIAVAFVLKKPQIDALDATVPGYLGDRLFADYVVGAATVLVVLGLSLISDRFDAIARPIARPVRLVADHTFELYLLHVPVAFCVAAISPFPMGDPMRAVLVYGAVLIVVVAAARISTPLKIASRRRLRAWFQRAAPARAVEAPAAAAPPTYRVDQAPTNARRD
ncbi:MAG TPA: acyltransferase, partial [Allosphingosinicella sp.]|nr:acyltransferase [Allosphingosinicella sp.]